MTIQPDGRFFPSGDLATRLHFGRPARDALADLVNGPWTLVISAGGLQRGRDMGLFGRLPPPSATVIVPAGIIRLDTLGEAWNPGPPHVVGIGAGSVLDAAKLVRLANADGRFPAAFRDWNPGNCADLPPLICVPTTAGSGSELTPTASVWDGGTKSSIDGPALQPTDAIYDPALLASASAPIRTAALWDAISHALEALWSRKATKTSDHYAEFALGKLTEARDAHDRVLGDLSLGSAAAGAAISITRSGIAHALSYPLTGRYGLRHGLAAGLFALATADILPDVDSRRAARIADALGGSTDALHSLWETSGARELVSSIVTEGVVRARAIDGLDPARANLSAIPPDPDLVAEICRRASFLCHPRS